MIRLIHLLISAGILLLSSLPLFTAKSHVPIPGPDGPGSTVYTYHYSLFQNLFESAPLIGILLVGVGVLSLIFSIVNLTHFGGKKTELIGNWLGIGVVILFVVGLVLAKTVCRKY